MFKERIRLSIPLLIIIYTILVGLNFYLTKESFGIANWYVTVVWSAFFPIAFVGSMGALYSYNLKLSAFNRQVNNLVIFQVPTIGRISNLPALFRVVDSILEYAPSLLNNFRIDIVTEELSDGVELIIDKYNLNNRVRVVVIPLNYSTKNKTLYKARANEYVLQLRRATNENLNDVWVYHLDDDTSVRQNTISSIAEMIYFDNGQYHLAQGILGFPFELSGSLISKLVDSIRPIDDLTKFYFFTKKIHRPLVGLHGEHLLIRSSVEDSIGWDFGPSAITEDAEFSLHFSNKYKNASTFLNSFSYGASPQSVKDLIKQRRRWSKGLIDLVIRAKVPLYLKIPIGYMVLNWATGFFQNIFFVLTLSLLLKGNTSPVNVIFLFIWSYNFAYQIWLYIEGLKINLSLSSRHLYNFVYYIMLIPGIFIFSLLESVATTMGLIDYLLRKKGFVVINKPA